MRQQLQHRQRAELGPHNRLAKLSHLLKVKIVYFGCDQQKGSLLNHNSIAWVFNMSGGGGDTIFIPVINQLNHSVLGYKLHVLLAG